MNRTKLTPLRKLVLLIMTLCMSVNASAQSDAHQVETEVMAVLGAFMTSFSASDPDAHTATYHFPHFRLARGEMASWQTREDAIKAHKQVFEQLPKSGWYRSEWIDRKILSSSDSKVHVATKFRRLREDGSEIVTAESLYVLTRVDGRWGIKLRSSYL